VREQAPQGDVTVRDAAQVLAEPVVEVEPAEVAELEQQHGREGLGDGPDRVLGVEGRDDPAIDVGEPGAVGPGQRPVPDDGGGDARGAGAALEVAQPALEVLRGGGGVQRRALHRRSSPFRRWLIGVSLDAAIG